MAEIFELTTHFVRRTVANVFTAAIDISYGPMALLIGADGAGSTRTDATNKIGRFGVAHYTNAEEPVALVFGSISSTDNIVYFGGGTGILNAATKQLFYTGTTTTTLTGSRRMTIDAQGRVGVGGQDPESNLDVHATTGPIVTLRRQDTSVTAGDMIGKIQFYATDTSSTTNFVVADIEAQATNTVATDINPGRLIFRTTGTGVAATPTERLRIDQNGDITVADTTDFIFSTSTGTRIGTATTEKIAFHNATPVIQRAGAAQVAVATTAATSTTPFGYTTAAQADAIVVLLNEIRAALVEKGIIKGAA